MIDFSKGVGNTFKINRSKLNLFRGLLLLILLCCTTVSFAQQTYTGTVNDASGVPLPGVNVVIQGTGEGTSTDFDGNYSISAEAGQVLVFSFVGFENQELPLDDNATLNVILQESFDFLDEIIVTGYGTQTRRELTASVVRVDSETIERVAAGSSVDAIKGQVAGVDITSAGGRPGQSPQVRIRGRRSISASNDPLYVVDGIPVTSSNPIPNSDDDPPFYTD
ncbi:carboxypeptidase-like regulatory domain-containing protein [Flavobacteriaceae bacterium]|nr:carboxypeptidase-like regulatory domain-containing protein [Flavobacteriaceae bacterium]